MKRRRLNSSYSSNVGIGPGWKYMFCRNSYDIYSNREDGKVRLKAIHYDAQDPSEAFDITPEQAHGFAPIKETPLQQRMRKALQMDELDRRNNFGPANSSKRRINCNYRRGDRIKYECGFDNRTGRSMFNDGVVLDCSRRTSGISYRVRQSDGRIVRVNASAIQSTNMNCFREGRYKLVRHKYVEDADGFLTDYCMYEMADGTYVFIFGDSDLYTPDNESPDWECETREEADEWFDNYSEEQDDNLDSSRKLNSAYDPDDTLEDLWQFVQEQKFDSRKTSKKQIAATFTQGFNKGWFKPGDVVVDYGGGAFDYAIEYCADRDVMCAVYDPFNRSSEYNKETMALVHKAGGADIVTCNNVLNVIKEEPVRLTVLKNINRIVKAGGTIYFLIHEGDGDGNSRVTMESKYIDENGEEQITTSWQNHQKATWYMDAIKSIWPQAERKGTTIIVKNA